MDEPLDQAPTEPPSTIGYSRVSPAQAGAIVRLKRINPKLTMQEIADAVGVKSVATVSHWLHSLDNDTVPEARKHLKSQALRAAMTISDQVDHSDPRVSQGAAKAVIAGAGVIERDASIQVGVQVVVGTPASPAGRDPWEEEGD